MKTNQSLHFDGEEIKSCETDRSDFYVVQVPVQACHDVMDELDEPIEYNLAVRIPIVADNEPLPAIVKRAKSQLLYDLSELSTALAADA